jgi:hypothetical protein
MHLIPWIRHRGSEQQRTIIEQQSTNNQKRNYEIKQC